ncbi:PepSY domain-containing protein [Streptococcus halotolerans]|uniref:PepSY domain-containing protein n=1 Tax=Streptococcus halotolerans TaxID=1814128 RepID=UPI000789293A|nr:PepSY domain-containing protein [Streptococcus halotolerans]
MKTLIRFIVTLLVILGLGAGGYFVYQQSQFKVSESTAKQTAMKDANLTAKDVTRTKIEKSLDDGLAVYEIDLTTIDGEYEYTIDGKTGDIITRDTDLSETRQSSSKDQQKQNDHSDSSSTQKASSSSSSAKISAADAIQIALKDAGLTEDQIINLEAEEDTKNGHLYYEIEFDNPATNEEHNYDIDTQSGKIVHKTKEPLDNH